MPFDTKIKVKILKICLGGFKAKSGLYFETLIIYGL